MTSLKRNVEEVSNKSRGAITAAGSKARRDDTGVMVQWDDTVGYLAKLPDFDLTISDQELTWGSAQAAALTGTDGAIKMTLSSSFQDAEQYACFGSVFEAIAPKGVELNFDGPKIADTDSCAPLIEFCKGDAKVRSALLQKWAKGTDTGSKATGKSLVQLVSLCCLYRKGKVDLGKMSWLMNLPMTKLAAFVMYSNAIKATLAKATEADRNGMASEGTMVSTFMMDTKSLNESALTALSLFSLTQTETAKVIISLLKRSWAAIGQDQPQNAAVMARASRIFRSAQEVWGSLTKSSVTKKEEVNVSTGRKPRLEVRKTKIWYDTNPVIPKGLRKLFSPAQLEAVSKMNQVYQDEFAKAFRSAMEATKDISACLTLILQLSSHMVVVKKVGSSLRVIFNKRQKDFTLFAEKVMTVRKAKGEPITDPFDKWRNENFISLTDSFRASERAIESTNQAFEKFLAWQKDDPLAEFSVPSLKTGSKGFMLAADELEALFQEGE